MILIIIYYFIYLTHDFNYCTVFYLIASYRIFQNNIATSNNIAKHTLIAHWQDMVRSST